MSRRTLSPTSKSPSGSRTRSRQDPGWPDGSGHRASRGKGHSGYLIIGDQLDRHAYLRFTAFPELRFQDDAIDLGYQIPAFIYHNYNDRCHFNSLAGLEADLSPVPGLDLYAQPGLDQATAPLESDIQPTCWGALGGKDYPNVAQAQPSGSTSWRPLSSGPGGKASWPA